ncbi:MAG: transposase [Proteobacteria bacterium]|nr:transposase [Pseudomonadota bacterium]
MSRRRRHTPEEKVIILKKHLLEKKPISEVCRTHGISPTLFYRWQQEFFEQGALIFQRSNGKKGQNAEQRQLRKLESELAQKDTRLTEKNEVLAELMEAQSKLKKNLGEI